MRFISLITFAAGALAVAAPVEHVDNVTTCGKAYVEAPAKFWFKMESDGNCHNTHYKIDKYESVDCGFCDWFEGHKCDGETTHSGGDYGLVEIPLSKSYRCHLE